MDETHVINEVKKILQPLGINQVCIDYLKDQTITADNFDSIVQLLVDDSIYWVQ